MREIDDLARRVVAAALDHDVGHARLAERALVEDEVRRRAQEDRAVAVGDAPLRVRRAAKELLPLHDLAEPPRDRRGLAAPALRGVLRRGRDQLDARRLPLPPRRLRAEVLRRDVGAAEELPEERVRERHDLRPRTERPAEGIGLRLPAQLLEDRRVRMAEAVDRLLLVADAEAHGLRREPLEDRLLEAVRVLVLVDEEMVELREHRVARGRSQEPEPLPLEVGEVEEPLGALPRRVGRVEPRERVDHGGTGRPRAREVDERPVRLRDLLALPEELLLRGRHAALHEVEELLRGPRVQREEARAPLAESREPARRARRRESHLRAFGEEARHPCGEPLEIGRHGHERGELEGRRARRLVELAEVAFRPREVDERVGEAARVDGLRHRLLAQELRGDLVRDREARVEPGVERALPEHPREEGVDRRDGRELGLPREVRPPLAPKGPPDPLLHLARRLLGERDGEDARDGHAAAHHEVEIALREHARLARAGAGDDGDRALLRERRGTLLARQLDQSALPAFTRNRARATRQRS